jgi:phenylpropionate dioxygenase-like ring-hydroxylating dioxygenase large terminal subunit
MDSRFRGNDDEGFFVRGYVRGLEAMTESIHCADRVALDAWHVLGAIDELPVGRSKTTRLLDTDLTIERHRDDTVTVRLGAIALPVRLKFGYVWTTLGNPDHELFEIPEYAEHDRRNLNAASVGLHVSAPRAVENFLDLGHFAFVHTNYLGVEPHTEIRPYKVEISAERGEILATKCVAYQPQASLIATDGHDVEYVYRVPHPYCAILYKSNDVDPARQDVIAIFLQPSSEERVVAHMLLSVLDAVNPDPAIRAYQQLIFSQDKPILENQFPKRLPLGMRSELSAKADASSSAYRRWLNDSGVRYGTLPA